MTRKLTLSILALGTFLALAGCKSSEERAEDHFRSGLELLAKGDEDRAMIEFRNVFNLNGFHKEARQVYADLLLRRGDMREAFGQYLRLIEQYPDLIEARHILAETAFAMGNWDQAERHGRAAAEIDAAHPRSRVLTIGLDYRAATLARDEARRAETAGQAEQMIAENPDSLILRQVIVDWKMSGPDPMSALPHLDAALALDPKNFALQGMKLRLLNEAADIEGVGAQLRTMNGLFPDNADIRQALIRWHMVKGDIDGAEAFLRAEADKTPDKADGYIAVVQFLNAVRSRDAGRAELERLVATTEGKPFNGRYRSLLATMDFEDGRRDEALAAMRAVVDGAEPSDETRLSMAIFARMLDASGQRDEARALVSRILEQDTTNIEALKMRAAWAISGDDVTAAIIDLRAAQSQAPRDPQIMTLLAAAFERDGNLDLAGEQLAKAVEASRSAPAESLRYARFLRQQGRTAAAEAVLSDARRVSPGDLPVLIALAEVLLEGRKWIPLQELISVLRQFDRPDARQAAQQLQAAILFGQNRVDEGLSILENEAASNSGDVRPIIVMVTTQLRAGKAAEAATFLDSALQNNPEEPTLRLLRANVDAILGNLDAAETAYRGLIRDLPTAEAPVRLLYRMLAGAGRSTDAAAVLEAGLQAMPDNATLLWIRAGELEAGGDFPGAIAIYEKLYARDSSDLIVANNLASMITTYMEDPASLERAAVIARRLRGSDVPAFQDTYGWIEYRRGNLDEAVGYLESAARGLQGDPLAQYHLGMAYADLGRTEKAISQLQRAIELGEGRDLPQLERARERLTALTAAN